MIDPVLETEMVDVDEAQIILFDLKPTFAIVSDWENLR